MKLLVEIYMDGYDSEEEMQQAAIEFIEDFDSAGVTIKVLEIIEVKND